MKNIYKGLSIFCASAILVGCGGGGGSSSSSTNNVSAKNAQLIDAPLVGVKYVYEDGTSGYTKENGYFEQKDGNVSFYVGKVKIGEISSIKSDSRVFLQDLLNLDRSDSNNTKLLNSARFLQSLDTDDSTDSIEIGDNFSKFDDAKYSNKNLNDIDVVSVLNDHNITIKSLDDVKTHLKNSIVAYIDSDKDTDKPTIKRVFPADNSQEVAQDEDIEIEFSENISKDSLAKSNIVLKDSNNNTVNIKTSIKDNKLVLSPMTNLSKDTTYKVIIDKSLKDYAGNSLADSKEITFRTVSQNDTIAPILLNSVPSHNGTNVDLGSNLVINFSEKMNDDTINSTNITLNKKGSSENLAIKISHANKQVVVTALKLLEPNTEYVVKINAKVADTSNNTITSSKEIAFTTNDTLKFNDLTYKVVKSPITGKFWLDRNLGASEVCSDKDQENCYGDYYQWGRNTNGHEKKRSIIFDASKEEDKLEKDVLSNGKFAVWADDWRKNKNDTLWKGVDAPNNVCPTGYKVPSIDEILIETNNVNDLQFPNQKVDGQYTNLTNFLKLPNNGFRSKGNPPTFAAGELYLRGYAGNLWTSSVNSNNTMGRIFEYFPGGAFSSYSVKTNGYGVRCMQDYSDATPLTVSSTTPSQGQTDVSIDSEFRIEFAKPVISSPSRDNILLFKGDTQIRLNILRNISTHSLVISLDKFQGDAGTGLYYDTEYKLVIKKELYDVSGNTMAEDKVITFKTAKSPENQAPKMSKSYPKSNAKNFSRNENIRITFSKELNTSTLDNNILIKNGSQIIPSTLTYEDRRVTLNPSVTLDANTTYNIEISTDVKDTKNLNVENNESFGFTTGDTIDVEDRYGNIYKEITSIKTKKVWLDRNLGALKACEYLNESDCYGDYFQWGRKANGHEKFNSLTTNVKLSSDVENDGKFVKTELFSNEKSWMSPMDETLWSENGANNVCPTGYRVPTISELENELEGTTKTNLFDNFLKIPTNGRKSNTASKDGSSYTYIWSATTTNSEFAHAKALKLETLNARYEDEAMNSGLAVRCIKK